MFEKAPALMTSADLCDEWDYWKAKARVQIALGNGKEPPPRDSVRRMRAVLIEIRKRPDIKEVPNA
jgi:hypothetical protein